MFERFDEASRQAIVLAQAEARLLRHHYIGTEHLLAALLRDEGGKPAHALAELGVRVDDVRRLITEIVGWGEEPPPVQIPFTPRLKKALELSMREGLALNSNELRPEHLLLGFLRVPDGVGMRVLLECGIDAEQVRERVFARMGYGEPRDPRERLAAIDLVLTTYERREEVARVAGEAADLEDARTRLSKLLGITEDQAHTVLYSRVSGWTEDNVARIREERAALLRELDD